MTWILFAIILLVVLWFVLMYNGFVRLNARADEAWSDIEVQSKRRVELIPNLVNTVKGYASHESGTLEKVIQARNMAMQAGGNVADQAKAENILTGALKSVFALSESYPDLKANTNFLELQRELSDTENKIQAARRFYNTNVRDLNVKVDSFPSNLIASMFHFVKRQFFDLDDSSPAQEPVQVKF